MPVTICEYILNLEAKQNISSGDIKLLINKVIPSVNGHRYQLEVDDNYVIWPSFTPDTTSIYHQDNRYMHGICCYLKFVPETKNGETRLD